MGKIARAVAVAAVSTSFLSGVTFADTANCTGSASNTGPGSSNVITCNSSQNSQVSCVNNIVVRNNNNQNAASGGAFTTNNTNAGSATSGAAMNNNSTAVTLGASCTPVATTAAPTPTPTTPQVLGNNTTKPQVKAPAGAVHAGGGAASATNSAVIAGFAGSAAALVAGIALAVRKRAFNL